MKIKLNRAYKYFEISEETPQDVIVFVLNTMGKIIDKTKILKKMDKISKFIESYDEEIEINQDYSQEDLRKISSYVSNTDQPWERKNLVESFEDLLNFYNNFSFPDIRKIKFGERNNDFPKNYDVIMIYILCKKLKIKTSKDDCLESMKNKLFEIHEKKDDHAVIVKKNLSNMNSLELYHASMNTNKQQKEFNLKDNETLKELSRNINLNYIIRNSLLSEEEAIVYSAKFFNYDISESKYPIEALMSIVNKKNDTIEFNIDEEFTKKFLVNNKFYRLDKFWRKNINFLYTSKIISLLKVYENLEEDQDLDTRRCQNNFYEGIINFDKEIIRTENIVTFGNIEKESYEVLDVNELEINFSENMDLGKYEENIEKLVNICRDNSKNEKFKKLHKTIRYLQKFGKPIDNCIKYILRLEEKHVIKSFFEKIYEISQTLKNREKINDIDNISLNNLIGETISFVEKIKDEELKNKVTNLKLVKYENEIFTRNVENYYSFLLEDIRNMKNLKDKNKEYLESKRKLLAETSQYYFYLFYRENLFDIDN